METTIPRVFAAPATSFFLFGPRGTGKSTWARQAAPAAHVIDLLEPDVFRRFVARPERLREVVAGQPARATIIIDEVQKIPALLDQVHALVERERTRRFILTGSSTRKLKRTGVNLLAGRLQLCYLHPFIAAELGGRFNITDVLTTGMLPLVYGAADRVNTLASYVALYVKEEVQAEGLVRHVGHFARFLEALSFSHAGVLNITNVARECDVERKTVEGYLGVVEDLLLGARLPVFTRRARRAVVAHPKFYYFDAGVFRALRPAGPLDHPAEIDGAALEGLVWQHLRAWNDYNRDRYTLSYWRTHTDLEVDLIVYGPRGFWAIEVKNAQRLRPQDFRGLRAFGDEFPKATRMLLYRGAERLRREGVYCLPVEEFLRTVTPGAPLFAPW